MARRYMRVFQGKQVFHNGMRNKEQQVQAQKSADSRIDQPSRCYLFSRDPLLYFACSSVSLEDGQNTPKQSDMKKSSVETYEKKHVFDLFLKGANIMVFFAYSRKWSYVG